MASDNIQTVLKTARRIHFIGIGGVSMSALALIMKSNGYSVSGSDRNRENCAVLLSAGIPVFFEHKAENSEGAEVVVYTAAIKKDNPELSAAIAAGLPCFERADLLGAIMQNYACPIGVAGTHGKSTTTSMLSCILLKAGVDPTISVGANLPEIESNYHIGKKDYFIFESCEYAGSFLKFHPLVSLILNIDEDHLDFYKNIDDITDAFGRYIDNILPGGRLITNADDEHCRLLAAKTDRPVLTFGLNEADYTVQNVEYSGGYPAFDICLHGKTVCRTELHVPGKHNMLNALAAAAAADSIGISPAAIAEGLSTFRGAERRFDCKGKTADYMVVDDYSHHPTEIEATLNAARGMGFDKVILIFQPHTYSRTKALMPRFKEVLALADKTILCDIYAAREKDDLGVSSKLLADEIPGACYAASFEQAAEIAKKEAVPNSIILTMGAGDVYKTAQYLL